MYDLCRFDAQTRGDPRRGAHGCIPRSGRVELLSHDVWSCDTCRILGDLAVPKALFIILLIASPILVISASGSFWLGVLSFLLVLIANPIVRSIRAARYFRSDHFKGLREAVASLVAEHNAVVDYVAEIRAEGSFELGAS